MHQQTPEDREHEEASNTQPPTLVPAREGTEGRNMISTKPTPYLTSDLSVIVKAEGRDMLWKLADCMCRIASDRPGSRQLDSAISKHMAIGPVLHCLHRPGKQ